MKALGFGGFDFRAMALFLAFAFIACARTDFQAFDEYDESAGESGTDSGGRANGGASTGGIAGTSFTGGVAGTSFTGGVAGTSVTGGTAGTGGGVCRDGRELCGNECVLTDRDPNHCGGCFYVCPDYAGCIRSECVPLCDGSTYCNGICTDITRDPRNCGGCGYVCPPNYSCRSGYCSALCDEGFIRCDGVCVDWLNDPMNCGGCGYSCGRGMSPMACIDGKCQCPGSQQDCGAGCTNTQTDPRNCGRCGFSCQAGQFCADGVCRFECPAGLTLCDGKCTDLNTDLGNCGGCGLECGSRWYCSSGQCTPFPDALTYSVGPSPLAFVSACGQPGSFEVLRELDDSVAALMLPFPFRFYGVQTDSAWTSSNGVIGFAESTANFENDCGGVNMRSAVMAFWDDLATRERGVCVATLGSSPNRQFVVTWNDAFVLGLASTHLTFSVVLNEGSDVIDVLYGSMSGGGASSAGQNATIGLANVGEYALDCCNQPCVTSNTGRRYVPVLR